MEKITRKLLFFMALFVALQSYAQQEGGYYDDPIEDDSEDAWVTEVDPGEWVIQAGGNVAVTDDGRFFFGGDDAGGGHGASSGHYRGTVSSPDFSTNAPITLVLDMEQSNQGGGNDKNAFDVVFTVNYTNTSDVASTRTTTVHIDLKTTSNSHAESPATLSHETSDGRLIYTIQLPLPGDYKTDGHTSIAITAGGGLIIGTSSSSDDDDDDDDNTIDVYSEELVLDEKWDNTQRLEKNAGKKLKMVKVVRHYAVGWNTLSLPFNFTMPQFQYRFWKSFDKNLVDTYNYKTENCAELWHYSSFSEKEKIMHFTKHDNSEYVMEAGVPYLLYIPENIYTQELKDTMRFTNIVLYNPGEVTRTVEKSPGYKYASNLSRTNLASVVADNQVYYLGLEDGKPVLKKPTIFVNPETGEDSVFIKGFRAYFVSPKGETAAPAKNLSFLSDNTPTQIDFASTQPIADEKVFNLQGQFVGKSLQGLPRGVYVVNRKKHIVK